MKNEKEKAEPSATEVIVTTDTIGQELSPSSPLGEALILRPEWEVKPKAVEMVHRFTVSFNESTKILKLTVNGDKYREMECKDLLSGKIKFHDGINEINNKFNIWKYDVKKN